MSVLEPESNIAPGGPQQFATTHWSLVLQAADSQAPAAAAALEQLCGAYWYPLYAFVRRSGHGPEEARDLTQEFFARLLQKKWIAEADPQRGRFRTFMVTALKHFLANEWHRSNALKRGGGREIIPLDGLEPEQHYALEPQDGATPESIYQRQWALTLVGRAQERLRQEMVAAGERERFEALEPTLAGERTTENYASLAEQFKVSETGVKSMVVRLRRRFRQLLLEEVRQTLSPEEDAESELRELFTALGA
jgi:RNA polymerase sigma-70 factor (ECF subfamily)